MLIHLGLAISWPLTITGTKKKIPYLQGVEWNLPIYYWNKTRQNKEEDNFEWNVRIIWIQGAMYCAINSILNHKQPIADRFTLLRFGYFFFLHKQHQLYVVCTEECCWWSVQFSSVTQWCPILCDPMKHSTPGLSVHHQLLKFTQTHVHQVSDAIQPSHPLSSPSPPAPNSCQQSLFQWVNSSHEVAKVLEFQL